VAALYKIILKEVSTVVEGKCGSSREAHIMFVSDSKKLVFYGFVYYS